MRTSVLVSGSIAALCAALPASAQTEISWWHSMSGALGERLEEVAQGFNDSQDAFVVTPFYRGEYAESMTAAIAAFRAGEQPHILQVFEVGTGTMMAAEGAIYPIYQLMADNGMEWDPSSYLPAVVGYYSDPEGNMLSFPFNSSTPILYYNKAIFAEAGLDPETPPTTWAEVEQFSQTILDAGAAPCGFTTRWPSWVQLENLTALHKGPLAPL